MPYPLASASNPVVFVHVPKTSGSSVHGAVKRTIGVPSVRIVSGRTAADIETVKADKGQYRYVGGHIKYPEAKAIFESAIYVTAIRNPLHRVLSHYFHLLRTNRAEHIDTYAADVHGHGFYEYYRRIGRRRANLNCRFICGKPDHQRAIQYLTDFFSVAWMADHPETGWPHVFRMLQPNSAVKPPSLGSRNAAPIADREESLASGARPANYDAFLTDANRSFVLSDNEEDMKLFQWLKAQGGLMLAPEILMSSDQPSTVDSLKHAALR